LRAVEQPCLLSNAIVALRPLRKFSLASARSRSPRSSDSVTEGAHYCVDILAGGGMAIFAHSLATRMIAVEARREPGLSVSPLSGGLFDSPGVDPADCAGSVSQLAERVFAVGPNEPGSSRSPGTAAALQHCVIIGLN
jgi:hypothetical protein